MKLSAGPVIKVVIPARDEARSIGAVIIGLPTYIAEIIVVDNGSRDGTAAIAATAGAKVVKEPRRGYGRACKAGIKAAMPCDILLFLDGDAADDPSDAASILAPIIAGDADLVIGSRLAGRVERGAMTPAQRWGGALAGILIRLFWGQRVTDLGPFRAIRADALARLGMDDNDFGWTVEMQVRAAKSGLRMIERPVTYRRRLGVSKISGTVSGTLMAGATILYVIFRERMTDGPLWRRPQR